MKHKRIELDVDFVGGAGQLTKPEENLISEYFRSIKTRKKNKLQMEIRRQGVLLGAHRKKLTKSN